MFEYTVVKSLYPNFRKLKTEEAVALIANEQMRSYEGPVTFADLGCGTGTFTRALAALLPAGSTIYAIDKTKQRLAQNFPHTEIIQHVQDFEKDELPFKKIHGILMANSMHYVQNKIAFINKLQAHLTTGSIMIVVEYDTSVAVPGWVPYPLSYSALKALIKKTSFRKIEKTGEKPSVYGRANLYGAVIGF